LIVISFLMLVSCVDEIAFKGSETAPRLVVNCIISPDSLIIAHVSQSNSIQKPPKGNNIVTNAVVRLYENSQFIGFLTINNQEIEQDTALNVAEIYGLAGLKLTAGNLYKLEVEAPGFEPVYAQVAMPKPVEIIRVDTSYVTIRDYWDRHSSVISFTVTFNDPSAEKNYYRLVVKEAIGHTGSWSPGNDYERGYYNVSVEQGISSLGSNDLAINPHGRKDDDSFMGSAPNKHMAFSDLSFDGKEATVSVYIDRYRQPVFDRKEFSLFEIELHSISKEYYLYQQSLGQFYYKHDDPFAEPVQVFSNIINGHGIFAAYSTHKFSVLEGIYPDESDEYTVSYFFR
jgi:hypothetical protein